MVAPRDKLEDFKYSSLSVVKPPLAAAFAPFATGIPTDLRDIEKAIQDAPGAAARAKENEELMSEGSIAGVIAKGSDWEGYNREIRERLKANGRAGGIDVAFLAMLDEIERLSIEIAALETQIETLRGELVAEYGEDFLEDMAQMYLSEDELAALEGMSEAERQASIEQALMDKMLDEDGNLKPEYAGTTIGQYVYAQRQYDLKMAERDAKLEPVEEYVASGGTIELAQTDTTIGQVLEKDNDPSSLSAKFEKPAAGLSEEDELLEVAIEDQDPETVTSSAGADFSFSDFGNG